MPLRLLALAALFAALLAGAPAAARAAAVEHTVTVFTVERDGAFERDEQVETWVSPRRAKSVYTDRRTGAVLGGCAGTRRRVSCFDRVPALELMSARTDALFLPTWAEQGRAIRRGLARGWLEQTAFADHRGAPVRRLRSTAAATGDGGESLVLAARETLMPLYRRTASPDGTLVTVEDVLLRERLRPSQVDFRLRAPAGRRVRTKSVPR